MPSSSRAATRGFDSNTAGSGSVVAVIISTGLLLACSPFTPIMPSLRPVDVQKNDQLNTQWPTHGRAGEKGITLGEVRDQARKDTGL